MNKANGKILFDHRVARLADKLAYVFGDDTDQLRDSFRELSHYFAEKSSKWDSSRNPKAPPKWNTSESIPYGDYLINIACALKSVDEREHFLEQGKKLVDLTERTFQEGADTFYVTGILLSDLGNTPFVRSGRDLANGLEICINARNGIDNEPFYGRIVEVLDTDRLRTMRELETYVKHRKTVEVLS